MTNSAKMAAFREAYEAWDADPVKVVDTSRNLWDASTELQHLQTELGPTMKSLYETGTPLDAPPIERWHDGMTFVVMRALDSLRKTQRNGRHQLAIRELVHATTRFKNAWSAYRSATGR